MQFKLSKQEEQLINQLPESLRESARTAIIDRKRAKHEARNTFSLKVSELGKVSAYGLGSRFPTTLSPEQWNTVLSQADTIRKFISENQTAIATASAKAPEVRKARAAAEKLQVVKSA